VLLPHLILMLRCSVLNADFLHAGELLHLCLHGHALTKAFHVHISSHQIATKLHQKKNCLDK